MICLKSGSSYKISNFLWQIGHCSSSSGYASFLIFFCFWLHLEDKGLVIFLLLFDFVDCWGFSAYPYPSSTIRITEEEFYY